MHFIGIEIGPAATRVLALDVETATIAGAASAPHEWLEGLPEGYREQDPAGWIRALDRAMRELLEELGDKRREVVAIGLTAPSGGLVVLDGEDRVVRPAKLGEDRAARREIEQLRREFGGAPGLIELTGNAPDEGSLAAQLLWLKEHEPAHFERVARVMTPQDFLGYWLTGEVGSTASTAATTGLFSIPSGSWCRELVESIDGRVGGLLSPGLDPGLPRGELRPALAEAWGLSPSVLVAPGLGSEAASLLAAGAAAPGEVVADLSADGSLSAIAAEPVVDFQGEASAGCEAGGRTFLRFALRNVIAAVELVRRHYGWGPGGIEDALKGTEPGAADLLFLPYLRGEAVPRMPEASGVLHGLRPDNFTPANLARAAAEGVALGFGYAMSRLRDLGFEPERVRLTRHPGPLTGQLLADVFGVPVAAVSPHGGAIIGALMQAAVVYFRRSGESLELDEIARYVVNVDEASECEPDAGRTEFYDTLLARQQYLVETLRSGGFL